VGERILALFCMLIISAVFVFGDGYESSVVPNDAEENLQGVFVFEEKTSDSKNSIGIETLIIGIVSIAGIIANFFINLVTISAQKKQNIKALKTKKEIDIVSRSYQYANQLILKIGDKEIINDVSKLRKYIEFNRIHINEEIYKVFLRLNDYFQESSSGTKSRDNNLEIDLLKKIRDSYKEIN
jgi:hypothetical protein